MVMMTILPLSLRNEWTFHDLTVHMTSVIPRVVYLPSTYLCLPCFQDHRSSGSLPVCLLACPSVCLPACMSVCVPACPLSPSCAAPSLIPPTTLVPSTPLLSTQPLAIANQPSASNLHLISSSSSFPAINFHLNLHLLVWVCIWVCLYWSLTLPDSREKRPFSEWLGSLIILLALFLQHLM